jgi:hypothetical protein
MAYRWKNYGTPIEAEQAQQMQGFVPSFLGQQPLTAPTELDVVNGGTYYGGDRGGDIARQQQLAMQSLAQNDLRTQLMQLESELVQIDAQIAEIEKTMPKGVSDAEWEIAAKRAEIGDNSAYDNLVSRGYNQVATARSAEDNIKNELYNAEKLTWGLKAKSDEDREMAKNQIEVSLRKAEDMAAKTGTKLPEGYYRLKAVLNEYSGGGNPAGQNIREFINEFKLLQAQGKLTRAKREEANKLANDKLNSDYADELRQLYADSKGKTVEDGNDRKVAKQKATDFYNKVKNMSPTDVKKELDQLDRKQLKNLMTYYKVTFKDDKAFISSK